MFVCVPQVRSDREKFTVYLDVKHFSPDELTVKITDDYVEIQGKHGERQVRRPLARSLCSLTAQSHPKRKLVFKTHWVDGESRKGMISQISEGFTVRSTYL